MSNEKQPPTHRISFSEIQTDENGNKTVGRPVEVGVVWARDNGKHGGIIDWSISPKNLGEGVYYHLENERSQQRSSQEKDGFDQTDASNKERDAGLSR